MRHALKPVLPREEPFPEASPLVDRLLDGYMPRSAISLTYSKLINNSPDPLQQLRTKWEQELQELDEEEWREALASPREVAISKLVQLKVLHRIYYTGHTLVKMGYKENASCRRNCSQEDTFLHIVGLPTDSDILGGSPQMHGGRIGNSPRTKSKVVPFEYLGTN